MDLKKSLNKIIADMLDENTLWIGKGYRYIETKEDTTIKLGDKTINLSLLANKKGISLLTDEYTFILDVCENNNYQNFFTYTLIQKSDRRSKPYTLYGENILEESKQILIDNENGVFSNINTIESINTSDSKSFLESIENDLIEYSFPREEKGHYKVM